LRQQRQDLKTYLIARWMARSEVLDLAAERDAAKASLKLASNAAILPLKTRPDYRDARDAYEAARARAEAIREVGPDADLAAAATVAADASAKINRFETDAVAKSPEVVAARKRMAAADAALAKLQKDAVAIAESDQQYKDLSQAIDDTLADLDAAAADLAQATTPARAGEFVGWEEVGRWESAAETTSSIGRQPSSPATAGPWRLKRYQSSRGGSVDFAP
jgi:hypothetical protein